MTKRFWAVLAVLGLAFLGAVWVVTRPLSPRTVTLPDGRRLALEGVTFGTEHRLVKSATIWQQALGRWLPAGWARRLGIVALSHRSDRPSLMVWIHRWDTPGNLPIIHGVSVLDEQGHALAPSSPKVEAYPGPCQAIAGWEFVHFPRRARQLRVRLYYADSRAAARPAADFLVRNPARRRHPVWQPEPFPITKTRGELTFTLVDLFAGGVGANSVNTNYTYLFEPLNTALFRVAKAGRLTTDWRVGAVELEDATGNHLALRPAACASVGEFVVADVRAPLWPSESCWKLTAEFYRIGDFQVDELVRFAGVAVPPAGGQVSLHRLQPAQGAGVRVLQLKWAEPQGVGFAWLPRWNAQMSALLESEVPGLRLVLAGVNDQRGRELRHQLAYQTPNRQHHFQLEIPDESTALELRFAVQRTHVIEFLAQPSVRAK